MAKALDQCDHIGRILKVLFLNGPFSFIFGLLKQTLQIFTTNICENMSIQYTAPGPSERESPPITTKPVANLIKPL